MNKIIFALLLLASTTAVSQQYPSRPVRIVVPLSPGGFADTPARMLAPRLSEQLGRQFFVENKPGAGGTIGWDFAAKSAPDGHTLVITGTTHLITAHLYKNLAYDVFKDFTHIAMLASGPYVLVVNPQKVPAGSVRELIALAKSKPGRHRLRKLRQRQLTAPGRRAFQLDDRHAAQSRPLQGQRAGDAGPSRRAGRGLVCRRAERAVAREVGPAESVGRDHREALERAAQRADAGRGWRARLRSQPVAEHLRPGQHAGRDRAAAQCGDRQGPARSRAAGQFPFRRRRRHRP